MAMNQQDDSGNTWNLVPLTPEYHDAEHGRYVTAIENALADVKIRNIALSGNYGVGKSSILGELSRRLDNRVVELSLSTLAPIEAYELDKSVPKQATTPTNRIQQEIVKQLLYRENPSNTPGSRFRRIERFNWKRGFFSSLLIGFIVTIVFLLSGWTEQIASALHPYEDIGIWEQAITWIVSTTITLLLGWMAHGKLRIKQLSAGSATVTLDDNSVSYFDQYLDEIVYFFDVSERDIVIFEDIDRFNDSYIFETLRALNTLLNASPQIKRPVRFIYAIKDSIFDRIGLEAELRKIEPSVLPSEDPALSETVRANRTKFFDLIIPVVPFITHRSARNLVVQLLNEIEHKISTDLLDLAAQYVPDMRLLKNVRNEFIVFRDGIFSGDGTHLNLSETNLFAIMLYKSTHLKDFEAIRLGTSKFDMLYEAGRKLVADNIKRIETERRQLLQRVNKIDEVSVRSLNLGERLIKHMQRTADTARFRCQNVHYWFDGRSITLNELKEVEFWREFINYDGDAELEWRNNHHQSLTFSRSRLAAEFGDSLDSEIWDKEARDAINQQIIEKNQEIKTLKGADFSELIKHQEFLMDREGEKISFDTLVKESLKQGLAYHLARAGYINRSFTLYTSTFHGDRVGTAATNFIIHHVERDLMDEYFELSSLDVDAIIRERGKQALKEPALYNIAILDHLLGSQNIAADIMIQSLTSLEESQRRFIQTYLTAGTQCSRFIERFTVFTDRAFIFLVNQIDLDDATRLKFVDIALSIIPTRKMRTDSDVSKYLTVNHTELKSLSSDTTTHNQAESISVLFADSNIKVPRLEVLGPNVLSSFTSQNLYVITYSNLKLLIGTTKSVALDIIKSINQTVYDYVLAHLSIYVDEIKGKSVTVESRGQFLTIIEDVQRLSDAKLNDIIKNSSPECGVDDIIDAPEESWIGLAENIRFPSTFNNLSNYIKVIGEIDTHLAKVLSKYEVITECSMADDVSKAKLAIRILASNTLLPSPDLRIQLVLSVKLSEYLSVDEIEAESGELFALLVKNELIADEVESYERLATFDWPTREKFITEASNFLNYITPELVNSDLASLLKSNDVDFSIKQRIIEHATEYLETSDPQGAADLAKFALDHNCILSVDAIVKMTMEGVTGPIVIQLLAPHISTISRAQLLDILDALDGDYSKLTTPGYDKPRLPNTAADLSLLERLKQEGLVGKYDENDSPIKVNKRLK
ncbi:hypothetical protein [Lelliottia sp. JS-SCA-14]|uniref:YobI family P-loop NTPase n=1 Tax=Lelliottia sp. JS-SCA-14 TaxID=3110110 RepID=UPI002D78EE06|nr:hypothetical protein [Lelliottia sp. JS-SCA-14]